MLNDEYRGSDFVDLCSQRFDARDDRLGFKCRGFRAEQSDLHINHQYRRLQWESERIISQNRSGGDDGKRRRGDGQAGGREPCPSRR